MSASVLAFPGCDSQARFARKRVEHEERRELFMSEAQSVLDRIASMSREERERRARSFGFNPEGPEAA